MVYVAVVLCTDSVDILNLWFERRGSKSNVEEMIKLSFPTK